MSRPPVTLPRVSLLSFDPTAHAADQKKDATGEAARPVGEAMQVTTTANRLPQSIADTVTVFDERERSRREQEVRRSQAWLDERLARAKKETFSEDVTITPSIAELLLRRNPDNRRMSKARLAQIKSDLENSRWMFNGESIIVSSDGYLNDGQTRLTACRDTRISLRSVVVFGVPRHARTTTDQGTNRTAAHYLEMNGRDDGKLSAAVAKLLLQHTKKGRVSHEGDIGAAPTKAEIVGVVYDNDAEINLSLEFAKAKKKDARFLGPFSLVAFCHLIFGRVDQDLAADFLNRVMDGVSLEEGDPRHTLRSRFIRDPEMPASARYEAIVRAWNAYRAGDQLTVIKINGKPPKVSGLRVER